MAWLHLSPTYTLGVFLILAGITFGTVQKAQIGILSDLKEGKWYYGLFFVVFFTMLVVRMFHPEIGLVGWEKNMNHAFFASIMRTPVVPPLDPWFAGGTLEIYYYLGHWCFATLGNIAHIPSWVAFQFVNPAVASVSAVQLYGIGKLLLKRFSLLPVTLLFITNPAFIYNYYIRGIGPYQLFENSAIEVIPATFTEYPLYTFLGGDAHAHGLAVFTQAFFLLIMVYLCTQWQKLITSERVVCAVLVGISLGAMTGMNVWNAFCYAPLFILAAIAIWYQTHCGKEKEEWNGDGRCFSKVCSHLYNDVLNLFEKRAEMSHSSATILYLWILVPLSVLLLYAPFFIMMRPDGAHGIGFVHTKTTLSGFFLVFGWFLFLFVCTLYSDIKKQPILLLMIIPFIIAGYPLIGFIFVLLAYLIARREGASDLLFGYGLLLVLFCELLYIKDINQWNHFYRQNTLWKFYYAAWFLLGAGSLCSVSIRLEQFMDRVCHKEKGAIFEKHITKLVASGIVILILGVPILNHEYIGYASHAEIQGLDGYAWLRGAHPDDYATAMYLHELSGEYRLVEAEGGPHYYSTRISSVTGIQSILGDALHEASWREDNPPGWEKERKADVRTIYEQPERASEIMEKYSVDFLILGAYERETYQIPDDIDVYLLDLVPIFTAGETTVYQRVQEQS